METPLSAVHKRLGVKFTEFAGWKMPLTYDTIINEVKAVRENAGVFDISHMGRLLVKGKDAKDKLQYLTTNNLDKLASGRVQYNLLTNERGGVKDDITVYMIDEESFFICVNAVNRKKVYNWLKEFVNVEDVSDKYVQIALQGPKSGEILSKFFDVKELKYYRFKMFGNTIISRTGYTGEDGFEIYIDSKNGVKLFEELVKEAKPCGLGARDVLRIEAGFPLYGNELSEDITPLEANLDRFVDFSKDFMGKEAILKKEVKRKLFGLEMLDRGVPRKGYKIFKEDREIGIVSSGTFSPTLNKGVALCFIDVSERKEKNEVEIDIRGKKLKAILRRYPFVRRR